MNHRPIEVKYEKWFHYIRDVLETAYLSHSEPWRQSGMSGPENRWISLRKPIADCIEHSGSFLDIGCANGYLLECILQWTKERGLTIEPFGLDISEKIAALAKQRLPEHAHNIFSGNSYTWIPSIKFDYVRTELVYVPGELEKDYIHHLLNNYLNPGGRLFIANYVEGLENPERGLLPGCYPANNLENHLEELGIKPLYFKDGFDPVKNRRMKIAVVNFRT